MRNNLILVYLFIFLTVLILLRSLTIINITNDELIGYGLMIYGLSLFYSAHIENRKSLIFIGSAVFLLGLMFFILGNFVFEHTDVIFIPAAIFILSISALMLFLSDTSYKAGLYSFIILFTAGIGSLAIFSTHGIDNITGNAVTVFTLYWPVLIILAAVVILVNRDKKEKK